MQSTRQATPVYRTIASSGPDHEKDFTVEVLVDDAPLGCGKGKSKRRAEKEAARDALQKLEGENGIV